MVVCYVHSRTLIRDMSEYSLKNAALHLLSIGLTFFFSSDNQSAVPKITAEFIQATWEASVGPGAKNIFQLCPKLGIDCLRF